MSDDDADDDRIRVRDYGATTTLSMPAQPNGNGAGQDSDSDEEIEFEAVGGEADLANAPKKKQPVPDGGDEALEIVLHQPDQERAKEKGKAKRPGLSGVERKLRVDTHKVHLLCLILASRVRNNMLNDELLQARLVSIIPLPIQNAFLTITPKRYPEEVNRSRMFDLALKDLISHWWRTFEVDNSIACLETRTWAQAAADRVYNLPLDDDTSLSEKERKRLMASIPGDTIKTVNSLGKRAILSSGSLDIKAQLFVAVCRALKIPARMIVSLQPLDWRGSGGPAQQQSQASPSTSKNPIQVDSGTDESVQLSNALNKKGKGKARAEKQPKKKQTGIQKLTKTAGLRKPLVASANAAAAMSVGSPATTHHGTTTEESEVDMEPVAIGAAQKAKRKGKPASIRGTAGDGVTSDGSVVSVRSTTSARSAKNAAKSKISSGGFMPTDDDSDDEAEKMRFRSNIPVRLRPTKRKVEEIDYEKSASPDLEEKQRQPVYWTEVYSRANKEWIVVDVTRKMMRCASSMEPSKKNPRNKMAYVIAVEEDNSIRDVTARYVKSFGASTLKTRAPNTKNQGDWWDQMLEPFKREYALDRDTAEDIQLQQAQLSESMPVNMTGFKDHPLYVLERHLKREEALYPRKALGVFREEPVYPRSSVVIVKSADQYMRDGLQVKQGEQPLKMVKARAMTINKRRAHEQAMAEGREEDTLQGLYSLWQTEQRRAPPILDGKVPKNAYGNLDLFAPHMLPQGGIHLPYKGIAKIAKQLGIDYAEAVTGFEFHKRRAIPVVEGVVVAVESQEALMEAYWEQTHDDFEKAFTKKQERCLKRWKKLINGLKIRNRLQREYGGDGKTSAASDTAPAGTVNNNGVYEEKSQLNDIAKVEEEEDVRNVKPSIKDDDSKQPSQVHNALPSLNKSKATSSAAKKRKAYLTVDTSDDSDENASASDGHGGAKDSEEFDPDIEEEKPAAKRRKTATTPRRTTRASAQGNKSKDDLENKRPRRSLRSTA